MRMIKPGSLLLGACLLAANVQAQETNSWWVTEPMVIDGNPAEWPAQFRYYDGGTKLQYSIANDSAYVYLCLKVNDDQAQMRLFRSGLTIFFDGKGKKKESVAITYPVKLERRGDEEPTMEERQQRQQQQQDGYGRRDMTMLKHRMMLMQNNIVVKGFNGVPDQTMPTQNGYNITAAMQWDSLNILCIEYKIPFAAAAQHSMTAADTVKPIALGFFIKGIEPAARAQGDGPDGDGPPPGGMGGGGGMNGGGGYNGNGGMNGGLGGGGLVGGGGGGMGDGSPPQGGMGNGAFVAMAQDLRLWAKVHLVWP